MMKHILSILVLLAAVISTSCGKIGLNDEKNNPYKPLELTTKSARFVEQGNTFSFEFIDRIHASASQDYIISPLSMQFLLGMILDGAQGQTADEICAVLGYGQGEKDAVDEYCLSMLQQLPQMDKKTKLTIANALFADYSIPVLESYKLNVTKYHQAEISNLDFSNSAGTLKTINDWCSSHTGGMIPKVLERIEPDIPLYLFNAMYFKGEWNEKFSKGSTSDESFTNESSARSIVKMMKQSKNLTYTENDIFQAVNIPYGNRAFSMVALLPKPGYKIADVIASLKGEGWNQLLSEFQTYSVDLWLPKFETRYRIKLNEILSAMGMPLAFEGGLADFSALSSYPLYLRYVQQDAIIKVDEEGTEAAVVSHAGFAKNAAEPTPPAVFHADHPFLYLITENSTGAILFAGKYSGN